MMQETEEGFLAKALESLEGAQSEFDRGRYNNCANRCYFGAFQAAIHALVRAGIQPPGGPEGRWGHAFVQAQFAGQLVNRRKLYAPEFRDTLNDNMVLRRRADYRVQQVTETHAARALRRTRDFLNAIRGGGGETT